MKTGNQNDGSSVHVKGSRLGLPGWVNVRLPKTEAQKMGVQDAKHEPPAQAPVKGDGEYVGVMVGGQLKLVPKGKVQSVRETGRAGTSPVTGALKSMGVHVVDVDAEQVARAARAGEKAGMGGVGEGGEDAPSETVSLTLPRLYMDALKWAAKSEGQSVAEFLYNSARRAVPQNLWGALIQGRPEDELQALKVSGGRVSLRPPPSPSEQIELDKSDDRQRLYAQLLTFPHDQHHPCGHCRKGNLAGRSQGETRVCANMNYTLGSPCHWPAQSLRNGGGCPAFAPKRGG